jgi:hypothetical protein
MQFNRKAVDLSLRHLENQLKRGEVDKELLEKLGWTEEQARRFAERMREQLQSTEQPKTAADEARRLQFEETLRSLDLRPKTARRTTAKLPKSDASEIQGKRSLPPPEWRQLYNAYTRSLSKQQAPAEPKK